MWPCIFAIATLPLVVALQALPDASALARQLSLHHGDAVSVKHGPAKLHLRRFASQRDAPAGSRIPCLSLTNIDVDVNFRRKGHARRAMNDLQRVAAQSDQALIVENVVSPHMHKLCATLNARPLWGSTQGRNGCHYWVPPPGKQSSFMWSDMAVSA